jgi:acetylornithine deacetylase/succinyl-diaminopimelate desuccinylase-like protein
MIDGGHAATSVSDRCRLHVNVRIKDSSVVDKAISILEDTAKTVFVPGTSCKLEIRGNRIPMSQREGNLLLCRMLSDASEALGYGPLEPVFVGGASDSAYASALEIPVVCATGPVVDFQHTRNERAVFSSMAQRAKIHCLTILNLPEI